MSFNIKIIIEQSSGAKRGESTFDLLPMQKKYEKISVTPVKGKSLIKSFVPSLRLITFLASPDFLK